MAEWDSYVAALTSLAALQKEKEAALAQVKAKHGEMETAIRRASESDLASLDALETQLRSLRKEMEVLLADTRASAGPEVAIEASLPLLQGEARSLEKFLRDAVPRLQSLRRTLARLEANPMVQTPPPSPQRSVADHRSLVAALVAASIVILVVLIVIFVS